MRIALLVEDTALSTVPLEVALAAIDGLHTVVVGDGRKAIDYLEGENGGEVCVVLTDLNMPLVDGFELIAHIRTSHRFSKIPVLVLSGSTENGAAKRSIDLGANAFFAKPYSPLEVRQKLEDLLRA